jgi:predicted MFS family arabinose efflux permease
MKFSAPALGRQASFWVSAGIVSHGFWTSAAPAMTYPLYAAEWRLPTTVITEIFALYPIVVVIVLTVFGDLSDHIGRRLTMLLGLGASLLGVLSFALAQNVVWLFVGRALMGVGVGLSAGPSTAAMVEFSAPGQSRRASSITTAAQAAGYVLAFLIGGGLIQYAPYPSYLSFWLLSIVLAGLFGATWFLPRRPANLTPGSWRLRAPCIPRGVRATFAVSAIAVTTAYTHGVLILSLGSQVAKDLVGSSNVLVNGAALSLFPIMFGVVGIIAKQVPSRVAIAAGAAASAASMALFAVSVHWHELSLFLAATATAGVGYSLLFLGGLEMINAAAPAQRRGGVLSALYLLAYLSLGVVALVLGAVATRLGLMLAIDLGAGAIFLLSAITGAVVAAMALPFRAKAESDACGSS